MKLIKVKYPTHIQQRTFQNKVFILETIRDLDEAIDIICDSMTEDEKIDPFAEDLCPYFGILWPAAEGLAQFLSARPEVVKGLSVLELGCGLGLPALVAQHVGAQVLATDYHPDVEEYFLRNSNHTQIHCDYMRLNWREGQSIGQYDVVMGSDILYESKHPQEVALGLIRYLKPQGKIILADPGRAYLQSFIHSMNREGYKEELFPITVGDKEIFVFIFEKIN